MLRFAVAHFAAYYLFGYIGDIMPSGAAASSSNIPGAIACLTSARRNAASGGGGACGCLRYSTLIKRCLASALRRIFMACWLRQTALKAKRRDQPLFGGRGGGANRMPLVHKNGACA